MDPKLEFLAPVLLSLSLSLEILGPRSQKLVCLGRYTMLVEIITE